MKKTEILEVTALVAAYSVAVSIVYDFFFFMGLGVDLSMTPIGPVDFLRGWMEWTSKGFFYFLGLLLHLIVRRIESWKTEDEIVNATSNPQKFRELRESSIKLIYWCAGVSFSVFLFLGEMVYPFAILGIVIAGCLVIFWFLRETSLAETLLHQKWSSLWSVLIFCAVFGFNQGADVMQPSKKYQMATVMPSNSDASVVNVIKVTSKNIWT